MDPQVVRDPGTQPARSVGRAEVKVIPGWKIHLPQAANLNVRLFGYAQPEDITTPLPRNFHHPAETKKSNWCAIKTNSACSTWLLRATNHRARSCA